MESSRLSLPIAKLSYFKIKEKKYNIEHLEMHLILDLII